MEEDRVLGGSFIFLASTCVSLAVKSSNIPAPVNSSEEPDLSRGAVLSSSRTLSVLSVSAPPTFGVAPEHDLSRASVSVAICEDERTRPSIISEESEPRGGFISSRILLGRKFSANTVSAAECLCSYVSYLACQQGTDRNNRLPLLVRNPTLRQSQIVPLALSRPTICPGQNPLPTNAMRVPSRPSGKTAYLAFQWRRYVLWIVPLRLA